MRVKVKVDNGWCWVYNCGMKIEFGLMSIISLAILVALGFIGDVEMQSIDVSFSLTRNELNVSVDPVWIIWVPDGKINNANAFAWGNVMVIEDWARGNLYGDYLVAHEGAHIKQFHALGWWVFPAQFALPIEHPRLIMQDWGDPSQPAKTMWAPKFGWEPLWKFISISRTT